MVLFYRAEDDFNEAKFFDDIEEKIDNFYFQFPKQVA